MTPKAIEANRRNLKLVKNPGRKKGIKYYKDLGLKHPMLGKYKVHPLEILRLRKLGMGFTEIGRMFNIGHYGQSFRNCLNRYLANSSIAKAES